MKADRAHAACMTGCEDRTTCRERCDAAHPNRRARCDELHPSCVERCAAD